jgi:hypothetical protein
LGLDSPGTPPPPQLQPRPIISPVFEHSSASARPSFKPPSPDGGHARTRARLLDLDSRLLQVDFSYSLES